MTYDSDKLEQLISRVLDGQATPEEQKRLAALVNDDPRAAALYDEYRRLDHAVADAMRAALSPPRSVSAHVLRGPVGKGLLVAVAAGLAFLVWLHPAQRAGQTQAPTAGAGQARAVSPSWFAAPMPPGDVVEPLPSAYERPDVRIRGTQRDWIMIPGDEPGTYLIVEVDRVRTRTISVHRDF